jgi:hypothetical protein
MHGEIPDGPRRYLPGCSLKGFKEETDPAYVSELSRSVKDLASYRTTISFELPDALQTGFTDAQLWVV